MLHISGSFIIIGELIKMHISISISTRDTDPCRNKHFEYCTLLSFFFNDKQENKKAYVNICNIALEFFTIYYFRSLFFIENKNLILSFFITEICPSN